MDTSFMQPVPSPGFDPSDLMARPEIRQREARNQANMVSAPYEQANRMAAEKTNPMNAVSQTASVSERTDDFINRYKGSIV